MLQARLLTILHGSSANQITSFSSILFFVLLGDALLSFWVPNFLQDTLGSPFLMGLVMSFSSLIGLLSDLIFPQLLRGFTVRKLLLWAILSSFIFIVSLMIGLAIPIVIIFLISMAVWGVYYEFLHFSQAQFVADSLPLKLKSSAWAIIGIFRNMAYFLGPLLAGLLLLKGEFFFLVAAMVFVGIGLFIFILTRRHHERPISIDVEHVSITREVRIWKVLVVKVWPVVVISLFMGLIDATFWTTGAVWTETLSQNNSWGAFLLPAYQLPSLFMGILVARWKIYKGKKKLSEKFLLMTGLFLTLLFFEFPIPVYVLLVFISSIYFAVSMPLVEAVYSDIISRMGIERKHLVGLSASTISLAYIISPAFAGLIASVFGEKNTIALIGLLTLMVSLVLILVTPKKIRLPETEISSWKQ